MANGSLVKDMEWGLSIKEIKFYIKENGRTTGTMERELIMIMKTI